MLSANPACNPKCKVCHYKDLPYSEQLQRKQNWAERNLGAWRDALHPIRPAPEEEHLGYRSKSWMRPHLGKDTISFGMYRAVRENGKWSKEFVSWDRCPIHTPAIQETMENLRAVLAQNETRWVEDALHGIWIGVPHLVVVAKEDRSSELRDLDWKKILVSPIDQVWFHKTSQTGRKVFGRGEIKPIAGRISESKIHPIRAFRQIAQSLLAEAHAKAVEALIAQEPELVVDLYCGTGSLSVLLPRKTGWLGIEASKDAVAYANTLRTDPFHVAYNGTVEQRLADPHLRERIYGKIALYLNPPRSGLTEEAREKVVALIRQHKPTSIVYLSCSASSLARDLKEMEKVGYLIRSLQPYDFFPQTEHFETLAILNRA